MRSLLRPWCLRLLPCVLAACQPGSLTPDELTHYVADPGHELRQVQYAPDSTQVSLTYQPADLLATRELLPGQGNAHELDSLRRKYQGSVYFLLAFSRHGKGVLQPRESFAAYSSLLQTLAFQMGDYVRLITSRGDTLRPANYLLDRTYSSTGESQLLLAFPPPPAAASWRIQVLEFGLGTGNLSFSFLPARLVTPAITLP